MELTEIKRLFVKKQTNKQKKQNRKDRQVAEFLFKTYDIRKLPHENALAYKLISLSVSLQVPLALDCLLFHCTHAEGLDRIPVVIYIHVMYHYVLIYNVNACFFIKIYLFNRGLQHAYRI